MKALMAATAAMMALACGETLPQSMTPMRGDVTSLSDAFAVRVYPANPYTHRIRVDIRVYDQDFHAIAAQVSPNAFMLGAEASRPVLVVVPFERGSERKVRICTESVPFPGEQTQIKAQICGKFLGRRRS